MANLTGWHLLIIVAVIVLLFGAAKLPALAKSVGQSARVFKSEMKAMNNTDATPTPAAPETRAVPVSMPDATRTATEPGVSTARV